MVRSVGVRASVALVVGLLAAAAHAQPSGAPGTAPAAAPAGAATPAAATVRVERYDVQGNTLLAADVVAARLAAYLGDQPIRRLHEAAASLQELYRREGWGGVVAFLPEQTLDGGVVRLRVVEGRLIGVEVTGQQQFTVESILAALPSLAMRRTPRLRAIDAEIQLANENPARNLQVLLQPGSQPGEILAKLTVVEQPVQRFSVRVENTGSEGTGRWRVAAGWQHANLFGRDHVAGAEVQTSLTDPSALVALSGSYRVPLYGRGLSVDGFGAWSRSKASDVVTDAGAIRFSGDGLIVGGRLNVYLPRAGNLDQRLLLGLEWREYGNQCSVDGLGEAGCGAGSGDISMQPASLSYLAQWADTWRVQANLGVTTNLALGGRAGRAEDFDFARSGAEQRYTVLRANATASVPLGELFDTADDALVSPWVLTLRAALQTTGHRLVPGEQFGIGGAGSVRGYDERQVIGDRGVQAGVEFSAPVLAGLLAALPAGWRPNELRLAGFVDAGTVTNTDPRPCVQEQTRCPLAGAGLGVRAAAKDWSLRIDAAQALKAAGRVERGDWKLHAQFQALF